MVSWPPRRSASAGGADFSSDVPGQSRQIDAEGRPVTDFAIDVDPALMLLDDAEDGRQPKAGAFADRFGGEERFKNLRQNFRWNAAAVVAHAQAHKRTGPRLDGLRHGQFIEFHAGRFR